jgi:phosphohistidine phosphatase
MGTIGQNPRAGRETNDMTLGDSDEDLHLPRHAKSSWRDIGLGDHARPLSKRGRGTARAMAKQMERAKIAPDIVQCSTAIRAKETLEPIAKRLKPGKAIFERGIYECRDASSGNALGAYLNGQKSPW